MLNNKIILGEKVELIKDEIDGAKIAIAVPKVWNKGLLIYCHGHREIGIELVADLNPEEEFYKKIISEGWMVGMSSYRRQGVIVRDAIIDTNNIRDYVTKKFEKPEISVIEGRSMGGCIATGIVAIGAALGTTYNEKDPLEYTYSPYIPLIYLTNVSETGAIESYIEKVKKSKDEHVVIPALWEISREGHNLVTEDERYSTFISLLSWIRFQTFITVRNLDATLETKFPESTIEFKDEGGYGKIVDITIHHSIVIDFQQSDLNKLGIKLGNKFELKSESKDFKDITFGIYPFVGVPEGNLIAYTEPNKGYIVLTPKTFKYRNFDGDNNLKIGDKIFIPVKKVVIGKTSEKIKQMKSLLE